MIWSHVFRGIALQFIFGLMVLRWEVGQSIIQCLGDKVSVFLAYTDAGSSFVYGYLSDPSQNADATLRLLSPVFAFKILSVVFFFSFFVSILYYYGIMQWVVIKIGWLLQISVGTTAAESINAAANIFLGQVQPALQLQSHEIS